MDEVAETVPPLEKIVHEIEELTESGGKYNEAPHVIEVTLPMLCRSVYNHRIYSAVISKNTVPITAKTNSTK